MHDQSARLVCPEWDPLAPEALENQRCVYDDPLARSVSP